MIVFIRCNDIISDSRAMKYIDFLTRSKVDFKIIAWDRLGSSQPLPNAVYCPAKSKYNQGGIAAIIDRLKWMWFILKTLFSFHDDLRIQACDLDAAFPAAIYKIISRRENYVLFDVFDWISDTLYNQGRIVLIAFKFMEWVSIRQADHIIICEPERIRQIPYNIEGRYSVLQNIPSFATRDFLYEDKSFHFGNNLFTLVYVGGFTLDRCLSELIDGAVKGCYNLNIAGYGNKDIVSRLESLKDCPYIKYYGKVEYTHGLRIIFNSEIIYAMYSKQNPNHLYAAPNKFYEAMFVGKPIITTNGIITAEKVKRNGFGFCIDESLNSLIELISQLKREEVEQKSEKALKLWVQYEDATEKYLRCHYAKYMNIQDCE